jgi:hypothetical protein
MYTTGPNIILTAFETKFTIAGDTVVNVEGLHWPIHGYGLVLGPSSRKLPGLYKGVGERYQINMS